MTSSKQPRHPPAGDPDRTIPVTLLNLQAHLTSRDLLIADWLDRHGVLTTAQLSAAFFASPITASHRLAKLRDLTLIDRFHRPMPAGGFGPWHWVIGQLGAQLVSAARGAAPPPPRALRARHARLVDSVKLPHLLGVNQFFVDLHAHARHHPGSRLVRWWSEPEATARYQGRIHPDGHALWRQDDRVTGLFLEYDRTTEDLWRLVRKLAAYDQLAADGGPAYPVLFWLQSPQREDTLHAELGRRRQGIVPVATAVRTDRGPGPAGPVWALAGRPGRWSLPELPSHHGDPDSIHNANLTDPDLDQEL